MISILDANGNPLTSGAAYTVATTNPFRYRGYYYDVESGFYYLNSRYYDPQVGRFINADGIIGANRDLVGYNQFAYCSNNPVMYIDPTGKYAYGGPIDNTAPLGLLLTMGILKIEDIKDDWRDKLGPISEERLTELEKDTKWLVPADVQAENIKMIKTLDDRIQYKARSFLMAANNAGYALFITWGRRTNEQEAQFPDGVQNGRHVQGMAFDVAFWNPSNKNLSYEGIWPCDPMYFWANVCEWNPNDPRWAKIGAIGKGVGLKWGNTWGDYPHFYQ